MQTQDQRSKIQNLGTEGDCKKTEQTVFVGMSGGVDSSLSALLLKNAGYNVVGVYMKNWSRDLPGMKCPWAEDLADAKRVATKLDIDFRIFDFEDEYRQKVVDYMLTEFKKGNTPNPDIMCNQEIKFKLFYDVARTQGADLIATGHYANTDGKNLKKAVDQNKDQTYFLYRISEEAIQHTLFPLGDLYKTDVKRMAAEAGLDNAYKKESMGVCFVGEVGIRDFLKEYFKINPGAIIDRETGQTLGTHEGAIFYTIGQRHGLSLGGGLPYYIVDKDMAKNIVYVSKNLNDSALWTKKLSLKDVLLRPEYQSDRAIFIPPENIGVRIRHRAALQKAKLKIENNNLATLEFTTEFKRPASGQSAVFYHGDVCLGGGIIK